MNTNPDRITQERKILGHLRLHGSITPMQALRQYGAYRLGARIYNLRRSGYLIESKTVKGHKKHYCRYVLIEGK